MSVDKHLEARGVELSDDNSLPPGQRTQRVVKRVIAAVRAAESEFNEELRDANNKLRDRDEQVIRLVEELRKANEELRLYRVTNVMAPIEALTVSDRKRILTEAK